MFARQCGIFHLGLFPATDRIQKPEQRFLQSRFLPGDDLFDVTDFHVLPPTGSGQVRGQRGAEQAPRAFTRRIRFDILCQQEDVLRMEYEAASPKADWNPLDIQLCRTIALHQSARVVIHGDLSGQAPDRVLELYQANRSSVAEGDVQKDWQNLLLEERRIELIRKENGG
jgi:hypothetical protein